MKLFYPNRIIFSVALCSFDSDSILYRTVFSGLSDETSSCVALTPDVAIIPKQVGTLESNVLYLSALTSREQT